MFDPLFQPYPSNRYCITANHGMVATGSNLASAAGLQILRKGGNAVDAAIATAAALTVVEPSCNGLGSDNFAIVWMKDKMYGLNSSGYAPKNISIDKVQSVDGKMPVYGWTPITVPGAVKGWVELNKKFGKLSLLEDLQPAIDYAENGYPLSPMLAKSFETSTKRFHSLFDGKPEFDNWFKTFTNQGESYHFADIVKLKDHARTLCLIGESNGEEFYKGDIAKAIVKQSQRDGGFFTLEDLAEYEPLWVNPVSVPYHGYKVWEIPPNGQGIVALMALNILNNFQFTQKECADTYHLQFEAMKLAFADGLNYITDKDAMRIDYHDLLSKEYGQMRAKEINMQQAGDPVYGTPPKSGTVYLCTADGEGNMVSMIQSNYMGFGSGIVIEGYGISMQNRGADFSLDPTHANALIGGKRTYHTIIPGFLTDITGTIPVGPFGVMGGYMQPQGHVQLISNYVDFNMNPQQALDAPRWQWIKGKQFSVEHNFDYQIFQQLLNRGHQMSIANNVTSFGRGQMIVKMKNGVLVGGCESRTDSNIACY